MTIVDVSILPPRERCFQAPIRIDHEGMAPCTFLMLARKADTKSLPTSGQLRCDSCKQVVHAVQLTSGVAAWRLLGRGSDVAPKLRHGLHQKERARR